MGGVARASVVVADTGTYTTSPGNGIVRQASYTITTADLPGFDPNGTDKLVVTASAEKFGAGGGSGIITGMTYNGSSLSEAVQHNNSIQRTGIFYLDSPGTAGDLVVNFDGRHNGVGVSLLALSGTASGVAVTNSNTGQSTSLTTSMDDTFVVASHANNGNGATAQSPMTPLFDGPVGSAGGGSGYASVASAGPVTLSFSGSTTRPVTVAAGFDPSAVGPPPPSPEVILSTELTGRTVSGATASDIPWTTNGVADPGDLTATHPLFNTGDAQGRFAVDRNIHNEGDWSVDVPLGVQSDNVSLADVAMDVFIYSNGGALQTSQRDVDILVELLDSGLAVIDSDTALDIYANSGSAVQPQGITLDFSGNELIANTDYTLRITATGQGSGNNAGIDNLNVTGALSTFVIPEPASLMIWGLGLLGLACIGRRFGRRV